METMRKDYGQEMLNFETQKGLPVVFSFMKLI